MVLIFTSRLGTCLVVYELKTKHYNITKKTIKIYLNICLHCVKTTSNPKRGIVSKPIIHSAFNRKGQVDVIDIQS